MCLIKGFLLFFSHSSIANETNGTAPVKVAKTSVKFRASHLLCNVVVQELRKVPYMMSAATHKAKEN